MHKILVAVDGSEHAQHALDLASDLAVKYDSDLIIIHVTDPRPLSDDEIRMAEIEYADELAQYAHNNPLESKSRPGALYSATSMAQHREISGLVHRLIGQRMLERYESQAHEKSVKHVETRIATGDPAQKIIRAAEDAGANLIVLGSRGQGPIRSLVLGSVSTKVNQMSPVNVITVR